MPAHLNTPPTMPGTPTEDTGGSGGQVKAGGKVDTWGRIIFVGVGKLKAKLKVLHCCCFP